MTQSAKTKKIFDGRYEIIEIVGRGACSVVYHARHATAPATDVALKVLLNKKGEPPNTDRLRKEALAMVSSRHRYVIRLDDFHSVGDLCYLSMEFAPGSDLRKYQTRKNNSLPLPQIERFLLQSAEALGFIHRAGIIHRDIKPDNILVMNDNEVRLGDFGVSVLPGEESTLDELQRGVGTMDYMAPEVLEGIKYDQRSDVYALGVTFYEVLAGKHPFANAPLMQQLEIRNEGKFPALIEASPSTPKYLCDVIMKAMSYDREVRFATGRDMLQAILVGKSEAEQAKGKVATITAPTPPPPAAQPEPQMQAAARARVEPKAQQPKESAPKSEPVRTQTSPQQRMRPFPMREKGQASGGHKPIPKVKETKTEQSSPASHEARESAPSPATPAVKMNEPPKKNTVSVPPAELGAALERSPKPTVVLSAELREAAGLSAEALMKDQGAPNVDVRASTATDLKTQMSGVEPQKRKPETRLPQKAQPISTQNAILDKLKEAKGKAKEAWGNGTSKLQKLTNGASEKAQRDEDSELRSRPNLPFLGGLGLIVVCVLWFMLSSGGQDNQVVENDPNSAVNEQTVSHADALSIPKVADQDIVFPKLAPGLYTGKLEGLIPGQTTPLTILSVQGRNELVFLLGIQGWSPAIVPFSNKTIKETAEDLAPRLRVASNGTILEFTGQTIDGELLGYFSNLVNGDQGRWEASPVR